MCDSKVLYAVLAALGTQQPCLTTAALQDCTGDSVHLLPAFTALEECALYGSYEKDAFWDLGPLEHLPLLTKLCLVDCKVCHLHAASRLTSLALYSCHATCSHPCVSAASLVDMCVHDCTLMQFHYQGISACSQLRSLSFESSSVNSIDDPAKNLRLNKDDVCVAISLSELTCLTELTLHLSTDSHAAALYKFVVLTSLQFLNLDVSCSQLKLSSQFSKLCRLTRLMLSSDAKRESPCRLYVRFDWATLCSLQAFGLIGNFELQGATGLRELASLPNLNMIDLGMVDAKSPARMQLIGYAMEMALLRPDVQVSHTFMR